MSQRDPLGGFDVLLDQVSFVTNPRTFCTKKQTDGLKLTLEECPAVLGYNNEHSL